MVSVIKRYGYKLASSRGTPESYLILLQYGEKIKKLYTSKDVSAFKAYGLE